MENETLTVVDNRTGREYSLPIVDGAIRAPDLRQITGPDGEGLVAFDPGVRVRQVDLAGPDRLDLGAGQHDARLERLVDGEIVTSPSVEGDRLLVGHG